MARKKQNMFIRAEKALLTQVDYAASRITAFIYDLTAARRERKSTVYGTVPIKSE